MTGTNRPRGFVNWRNISIALIDSQEPVFILLVCAQFVGSHLRLAGERNLAHLALLVANFELAESGEVQSEAVGVYVRADFGDDAVGDGVNDFVRCAIRAEVEGRTNPAV